MITISRPTKPVELCTDFTARAEWERAVEDEAKISMANARQRMSESSPLDEPRQRQADAIERMAGSTLVFTLQAIQRTEYRQLVEAHPPREGNAQDAKQQVNIETFGDALIARSILSVNQLSDNAPVDFDPASEWVPLADQMTNAQWSEFYEAAVALNQQVVAIPRKRVAS